MPSFRGFWKPETDHENPTGEKSSEHQTQLGKMDFATYEKTSQWSESAQISFGLSDTRSFQISKTWNAKQKRTSRFSKTHIQEVMYIWTLLQWNWSFVLIVNNISFSSFCSVLYLKYIQNKWLWWGNVLAAISRDDQVLKTDIGGRNATQVQIYGLVSPPHRFAGIFAPKRW